MTKRATAMVVGLALVLACTALPAGAQPASIAAGYRLHIATDGHPYVREDMALLENHTGYTDLDAITWSRHGRQITLVFRSRQTGQYEATYSGTLEPTGISTRRHPGTISGTDGTVGMFYAVDKTD